jgi:hypothetical protein
MSGKAAAALASPTHTGDDEVLSSGDDDGASVGKGDDAEDDEHDAEDDEQSEEEEEDGAEATEQGDDDGVAAVRVNGASSGQPGAARALLNKVPATAKKMLVSRKRFVPKGFVGIRREVMRRLYMRAGIVGCMRSAIDQSQALSDDMVRRVVDLGCTVAAGAGKKTLCEKAVTHALRICHMDVLGGRANE